MKIFFDKLSRKKSLSYSFIREFSRGLVSLNDAVSIYNFAGDSICVYLELTNLYILSPVPDGKYDVVYTKLNEIKRQKYGEIARNAGELNLDEHSEIVKILKASGHIINKDALRKLEGNSVERIRNELDGFPGELAVPVFIDERLELIMILGEKRSGRSFTIDDLDVLDTVADQMSMAVKHASIYAENVLSEKLGAVGMMSVTFAHELRNSLTSLKTFAQLVPEKYDDAEFRVNFSKIVLGEIQRIDGLIEGLIDVSVGEKSPGTRHFDVRGIFDEMIMYMNRKLELEKRNILIEKDYNNVEVNISGNAERLKHAFLNILNNGCQAIETEGVLRINITPNENNIDIAIEDNGRGILPENINSIYEPFVTTKEKGMGLGLAISKKIIEDHGGEIKVDSSITKGTTFTVSLPINGLQDARTGKDVD